MTKLEEVLIRTVAEYGIIAARADGKRGIWVGNDKIAAIGVRIARWVTSHGFALNVNDEPRSLPPHHAVRTARDRRHVDRALTGRDVPIDDVRGIVAATFAEVFERDLVPRAESIRLVKVMVHDGERVLLLHRRPERGNFWQPITGSIEEGEPPLDTARREVIEETGNAGEPEALDLQQSFMIESQFLASRYPAADHRQRDRLRRGGERPIRIDADEHDDYGWFTFAEAYEKIRWTDDREALEQVERLRFRVASCRVTAATQQPGNRVTT